VIPGTRDPRNVPRINHQEISILYASRAAST
jgi:hypothetical protein